MSRTSTVCIFIFLIAVASSAWADDFHVGDIKIIQPWARASAGPARAGAAYFTISNNGAQVDRLIKATTPVAKSASLHTHLMDGGIMKMRPVEAVEVSPGEPTVMQPGGLHIMLMGLSSPLMEGHEFPLTLVFENAGDIQVTVKIGAAAAMEASHDNHGKIDDHAKHDATRHVDHGQMGALIVPIHRISAEGVGKQLGIIALKDEGGSLMVMPKLHSLSPGRHGFHIHENGDCGPGVKDGKMIAGLSAGSHYGHMSKGGHHGKPAGDLPELVADANGAATTAVISPHLKTQEIAGRSIMIHAESEAAGSGARVACGVIPELQQ